MKYLDVNSPKHTQNLDAEIYKMLMKKNQRKPKQAEVSTILYSWFGRLNI